MSSLRNTDACVGDEGRASAEGMHEPAQVRYPRKRRENWPFRLYQENGITYQNVAPRRRQVDLSGAPDAPW